MLYNEHVRVLMMFCFHLSVKNILKYYESSASLSQLGVCFNISTFETKFE